MISILKYGRASRNLDEPAHYTDISEHSVNPFNSKSSKIAEMSLNDGLSASQVAEKLGISKTSVLEKLLNPHLHILATDGVYTGTEEHVRFRNIDAITDQEVEKLITAISTKVMDYLKKLLYAGDL